jgi:hypothetical protein
MLPALLSLEYVTQGMLGMCVSQCQVTIKGCTGPVNTFVVEPFVPHKEEYYLCIQVRMTAVLQAAATFPASTCYGCGAM